MQAVELEAIPTGIDLVRALTELEMTALDEAGRLARIVAWERVNAWVAAEMNTAIVDYVGLTTRVQQVHVDGRTLTLPDSTRTELACALHWSENTTGVRVELARTLARELPATSSALHAGALSLLHARAIADGAQRLLTPIDHARNLARNADPAAAPDVQLLELREQLLTAFEARVVPYAGKHSLARSREQITRSINRLDPDGVTARRHRALRTHTGVSVRHGDDGMSTLTACMPSELAVACLKTIDALATQRRTSHDRVNAETMGQLRIHAFTDLLLGAAAPTTSAVDAGRLATARPRVAVDVVIDLATLLGLRAGVATLNGVGAIPARVVRDLISGDPDATLRRLVVDPDAGHLLEAGTSRYAITGKLREYLLARDQRCRFPDCGRRAAHTDIDHATPWDQGGTSTPANLGALCRPHHLRKTHQHWHITHSQADGACTWTSPTGTVLPHDAITQLEQDDDTLEQLHAQLRQVWDHIELATEYAADSAPARARRQALTEAIDHQHIRAEIRLLHEARQHGHLCTILNHELQRHQRRSVEPGDNTAGTSEATAKPVETKSSDDTPPATPTDTRNDNANDTPPF